MRLRTDVKPITYLKNKTAELVKSISGEGRSVVITQNGKAKVVVMDVELYDRWQSSLALLKVLALAEEEIRVGKTVTQEAAFAQAEAVLSSYSKHE